MSMAWEYSDKTKQLFMDAIGHKENTHIGEIENPDGEGFHGSLVCGDAIKLTFTVQKNDKNPEKDIITTVKYLTFGCTSAIAASEALCIIVETKKLSPIQALKLKKDDIVDFLDGLPTQKIHCSIMGIEALHAAIQDWAKKRSVNLSDYGYKTSNSFNAEQTNDGTIVCNCMNMTRGYLIEQIKDLKLKTVEDVVNILKAGSICGVCIDEKGGIKDILKEVYNTNTCDSDLKTDEKTPFQISKLIEKVVDQDIKPILQKDGGNIQIVDIRDYKFYFKLKGTCKNCAAANSTIEYTIQQTLRDKVDPKIEAIRVD